MAGQADDVRCRGQTGHASKAGLLPFWPISDIGLDLVCGWLGTISHSQPIRKVLGFRDCTRPVFG
jgi:hypothetical protein